MIWKTACSFNGKGGRVRRGPFFNSRNFCAADSELVFCDLRAFALRSGENGRRHT